jgi:hypothetical protein
MSRWPRVWYSEASTRSSRKRMLMPLSSRKRRGVSPVQVLPAAQMWVIQLRPEEEGPTYALPAQNGFANVIGIVEI